MCSKVPVEGAEDLALAYTPGVAEPCKVIARDPHEVYTYTNRGNLVAILTDGSAVLGLGDIGPEASLPVMEGKALLFKMFGGVDAFPVLVGSQEPGEIARVMELVQMGFGGVNLEDVGAPRCFEVERLLLEKLTIPVFNDDQHGTAIVVGAAFSNALRVIGRSPDEARVVINGAGAAGIAVARMLLSLGVVDLTLVDRRGAIYEGREGLSGDKEAMSRRTNPDRLRGALADVLAGADALIGLSVAGAFTMEMLRAMRPDGIVFALANPVPEIWPVQALEVGAAVVGTGRSDFPNQINNVLGFPGVFRGALDVEASAITHGMQVAASQAIADLIGGELRADYVIPSPLDTRVAPAVAAAVAKAAQDEGVARSPKDPEWVRAHCVEMATFHGTDERGRTH